MFSSAGRSPDNVSMGLRAAYNRQLHSPFVTTVSVRDVSSSLQDAMTPSSYKYTYGYMVAAQFDHNNDTDEVRAVAFYNYEAYHTTAISLSLVDNTLLQHFVGANYSIETQNDHLVPSYSQNIATKRRVEKRKGLYHSVSESYADFYMMYLSPALTLVTNLCTIYLITERETGARRMQLINCVHPVTYWTTTFVCDFVLYLLSVYLLYVVFYAAGLQCFTDGYNLPFSALIFTFYGFAMLPFRYLVSLFMSSRGIGISVVSFFSVSTGKISTGHI